jgi:hypothetical protein
MTAMSKAVLILVTMLGYAGSDCANTLYGLVVGIADRDTLTILVDRREVIHPVHLPPQVRHVQADKGEADNLGYLICVWLGKPRLLDFHTRRRELSLR